MWDKINSTFDFLLSLFLSFLQTIHNNQLLRIFMLLPVAVGLILLVIWFFHELGNLDFTIHGKKRDFVVKNFSYYGTNYGKGKKGKPYKIDDVYKKYNVNTKKTNSKIGKVYKQKPVGSFKRSDGKTVPTYRKPYSREHKSNPAFDIEYEENE